VVGKMVEGRQVVGEMVKSTMLEARQEGPGTVEVALREVQ